MSDGLFCPDCLVLPEEAHLDGCSVARCTDCGVSRVTCEHGDGDIGWGDVWSDCD